MNNPVNAMITIILLFCFSCGKSDAEKTAEEAEFKKKVEEAMQKTREKQAALIEEQKARQKQIDQEFISLAKESADLVRSELKIAEKAIKKKKYSKAKLNFITIDDVLEKYQHMSPLPPEIAPLPDLAKEIRKELDMYLGLCGEKPPSCSRGCNYLLVPLRENAHDPDSIEIVGCTEPEFDDKYCWIMTCNIRGKNIFGAKILQEKTFQISMLGIQEIKKNFRGR